MTPLQKLSTRVRVTGVSLVASLAVALLAMAFGSSPAMAQDDDSYSLVTTVVPSGINSSHKMSQDIGWIDTNTHHYLLADRATVGVDVLSLGTTPTFLYTLESPNAGGGANGVTQGADDTIWYGDNTSHLVEQEDNASHHVICNVSTVAPGFNTNRTGNDPGRADELAYDGQDNVVLIANPDAAKGSGDTNSRGYITFVSTTNCAIKGRISFNGSQGIEQSQYSPDTGMFYLNIVDIIDGGVDRGGEIVTINPKTLKVVDRFAAPTGCHPGGLALGPFPQALVVCDKTGTDNRAAVIDITSGHTLARFDDISGGDEGWYNSGDHHYYAAANHNPDPTGPVIGVIDAQAIQTPDVGISTPSTASAHSVAADSEYNNVYVPYKAQTSDGLCTYGCIKVFHSDTVDGVETN